jgi:hypothetical protein
MDRAKSPIHEAFTTSNTIPHSSWIRATKRADEGRHGHLQQDHSISAVQPMPTNAGSSYNHTKRRSTTEARPSPSTARDAPEPLRPIHANDHGEHHQLKQPRSSANELKNLPKIAAPRPVHAASHAKPLPSVNIPLQAPSTTEREPKPDQSSKIGITSRANMLDRLIKQISTRQPVSRTWARKDFEEEMALVRPEGTSSGGRPREVDLESGQETNQMRRREG